MARNPHQIFSNIMHNEYINHFLMLFASANGNQFRQMLII